MKVLLINEKAKYGGAEMQTFREANIMRDQGHEVMIVTFDPNLDNGRIDEMHCNITFAESTLRRKTSQLFQDHRYVTALYEVMERFSPDYIHLNNTQDHALSIFAAIREEKTLQTIRDYAAVCPNGMALRDDNSMCPGYQNVGECLAKCGRKQKTPLHMLWHWICFQKRTKMRRRCVKHFACPSQMLTDYCNAIGLETTCINNPFDFTLIDSVEHIKREAESNPKVFLYYGLMAEHKGVNRLIEAFADFAKNKDDVELHLVGKLPEHYRPFLETMIEQYGNGKIRYLGMLPYKQMIQKLFEVHTVVVPSLWIENYPNTALEAIACGCLVLSSERGGMREIIGDDRFVFKIQDHDMIVEKLTQAYNLSMEEYIEITRKGSELVRRNNAMYVYYERLIKCLRDYCS